MRRLLVLVSLLSLVPVLPASASELDELLEKSGEAAYTAEQAISCSTPDGPRDAIVRIAQDGEQLRFGSAAGEGVEVLAGAGGWSVSSGGGVISSASVASAGGPVAPKYQVERVGPIVFLDREAMRYRLERDGVMRAELIFDLETGALFGSTSFDADGTPYCRRQFVSFDPGAPELAGLEVATEVQPVDSGSGLPETVAGFQRLDQYRDENGIRFTYFSDGFFSFAVFEARANAALPGGVEATVGDAVYHRASSPGQVTYVWETGSGVMAMVGDMPFDLQEAVLAELPPPADPGLLRRMWRTLFG